MEKNTKSPKIINLSSLAFERDKRNAGVELRDYFVQKNRQVKAAQLVTAMKSSLQKKAFSHAEAKKFAHFLAGKFDIRGPEIQHVQAGCLSPRYITARDTGNTSKITPLKRTESIGSELFHQLFLRLQSAVQEKLLDYNGARVLVGEIVTSYPASRDSLRR